MKGTILILAIVAMAGVGYASGMENLSRQTAQKTNEAMAEREHELISAQEFDIETFIANPDRPIGKAARKADEQTGVNEYLQVADEASAEITELQASPYSIVSRGQLVDLLTRCLEELRKAHGPVERLQAELDGFNKAIRTAEKNNLDLSLLWIEEAKQISKQLKLRRDIKAALEALQ